MVGYLELSKLRPSHLSMCKGVQGEQIRTDRYRKDSRKEGVDYAQRGLVSSLPPGNIMNKESSRNCVFICMYMSINPPTFIYCIHYHLLSMATCTSFYSYTNSSSPLIFFHHGRPVRKQTVQRGRKKKKGNKQSAWPEIWSPSFLRRHFWCLDLIREASDKSHGSKIR